MSTPDKQPTLRETLARRWQIPALALGLVLLGGGLGRTVWGHNPRAFGDDLAAIEQLRQARHFPRANLFLLDLLAKPDRPVEERIQLHRELVKTIHQAEAGVARHAPGNLDAIYVNFNAIRKLGGEPTAEDWVRVADAFRWAEETGASVNAYRQALLLGPPRPDSIRRRVIELRTGAGGELGGDAVAELDAILDDEQASLANSAWALELRVELLFDQGRVPEARSLIAGFESRLSQTSAGAVLPYLDALCLSHMGLPDEAEVKLRTLRNQSSRRDELWAKAGWLLGRLQQRDDRPQAALSFYDEVLRNFDSGRLHDACLFGRAESLSTLGRHARALETFSVLKDRVLAEPGHRYLDRDSLRTVVAVVGDSLLASVGDREHPETASRRELAIRYFRLALELVQPSEEEKLAPALLVKIGEGLRAMAEASPVGPDGDVDRGLRLLEEAGATFVELSRAIRGDGEASAQAAWQAIDSFDAAGRRDRVIELLRLFVIERPSSELRPRVLRRLGDAYQSEYRYPEAAHAYQAVITEFARLPDALASIVPLARSLIRQGGAKALRGADILLDVIDGRGPDQPLSPRSHEYREALIELADYYVAASETEVPHHFERAVERLTETLALYPDDPRVPQLTFLLADSYRQSAIEIRALAKQPGAVPVETDGPAAGSDRLRTAFRYYSQVIAALAPHDESPEVGPGLSLLEKTYLRMSYLYRGDCLFDLGEYETAIEAYEEAAWRYDNMPAAVSASMQIFHCFQRLGRTADARAVLGRLRWLIRTIPEAVFEAERGMPAKAYWMSLIERLDRLGAGP